MARPHLLPIALAILTTLALSGPAVGYGQEDSVAVRAPGVVDYHCVLSFPSNTERGGVLFDRDGDAGNISAEEADLYAAMHVRNWCQTMEDSLRWGDAPISHDSTITHTGLEGSASSADGAIVRLDGTARFNPPAQRVSTLSFETWQPWETHYSDAGHLIVAVPHNVSISLPAQWELRSMFGVHWTHAALNTGTGAVTDSKVTFVVLSPHQFPRDDWPLIAGVSAFTLVFAAVATYRRRRNRARSSDGDEPSIPSASPLDDDTL